MICVLPPPATYRILGATMTADIREIFIGEPATRGGHLPGWLVDDIKINRADASPSEGRERG